MEAKKAVDISNLSILVVDDNPVHQECARLQLAGAKELVIASSYDEASTTLGWIKYNRSCKPNKVFDIFLTDLLMPPSKECLGHPEKWVGQEMPVGIFLALFAAKHGVPMVAICTDSNHHDHPASAAFDRFSESLLSVGTAKMLFNNDGYEDGKPWDTIVLELLGEDPWNCKIKS